MRGFGRKKTEIFLIFFLAAVSLSPKLLFWDGLEEGFDPKIKPS